ncbi:guanitoxin biosynthesis heme-dependent pre-guanitoxin N-hydroxylase GntA [Streptomyces sp. N2A]|uniref:guanitoxin biosynthesis heme-dependent pre-guanitoxin N-hydroxylase GntA n=1 Tax=Streptomyces sp. N2A TaxID=3073936 RepID=UPI0028705998|nr:guanitoxin biosynthesis heme-dependent pre-guanitoxin N-hydroxylase GntA [Streptomyces sp. N2A]
MTEPDTALRSTAAIRGQLDRFIQTREFSCLGARAALKRDTITHRHYRRMGDENSARENYRDLLEYVEAVRPLLSDQSFRTFVATFDEPGTVDELTYEGLLWRHLQLMHDLDSRTFGLDKGASSDPRTPNFGFHTGGHAFFVVGMHPGASRASRRFSTSAIAFNSLAQFMLLGEKFYSMQGAIRRRETTNNGSVNPSFTVYEYEQPARHFSGRFTEEDWTCPYTSRHEAAIEDFTEGLLRHGAQHGAQHGR